MILCDNRPWQAGFLDALKNAFVYQVSVGRREKRIAILNIQATTAHQLYSEWYRRLYLRLPQWVSRIRYYLVLREKNTDNLQDQNPTSKMYFGGKGNSLEGISSLITDKSRVYKGGSWRDRAYWMVPGTRRYLDERESTDDIGFRCAMTRLGSPSGR